MLTRKRVLDLWAEVRRDCPNAGPVEEIIRFARLYGAAELENAAKGPLEIVHVDMHRQFPTHYGAGVADARQAVRARARKLREAAEK